MNKQKITIYYNTEFFGSIQKIEAYLIEYGTRQYAQYSNAPYIKFIPKGKRKIRMIQKSYKPYLLILNGWDNPNTQGMFTDSKNENGIITKKSLYSCYDERYKTDFNKTINNYSDLFIADFRENKGI